MFISEETFARLHQAITLEQKAKLRMIADNNKLRRILREIKNIAEETIKTTGMISAGFILQKIAEMEEIE